MTYLTDTTWKRVTVITDEIKDGKGTSVTERSTYQHARLNDAPVMHTGGRGPWQPEQLSVTDKRWPGSKIGEPPAREVAVQGHYVKKDGSLGQFTQSANWRAYERYSGSGSLVSAPAWVLELVERLIPAEDGVLTGPPVKDAAEV